MFFEHYQWFECFYQYSHTSPYGKEEWWNEGKKHREDGPTVTYIKKDKTIDREEWWLDGVEFSKEDFQHELSKKDLNKKLNEELAELPKVRKNKI